MRLLAALMAGALAACSGPAPAVDEPAQDKPQTGRPDIAPEDFVLLPCSAGTQRPCALVMAGGKRLMFGAPAGASRAVSADDLAGLDALMLFSLHPEDVEDADGIRYRGWRAGRLDKLAVTGPEGTAALVEGLNTAFEQPDAISFVADGTPPGGFVAALLSHASTVSEEAHVYDSGDLKVRAAPGQGPGLSFRIGYRGLDEIWHEVLLRPCSGGPVGPGSYEVAPDNAMTIACADGESTDKAWPLEAPVFVVKSEG